VEQHQAAKIKQQLTDEEHKKKHQESGNDSSVEQTWRR
jgi:hypothetical protein